MIIPVTLAVTVTDLPMMALLFIRERHLGVEFTVKRSLSSYSYEMLARLVGPVPADSLRYARLVGFCFKYPIFTFEGCDSPQEPWYENSDAGVVTEVVQAVIAKLSADYPDLAITYGGRE